MELPTEHGPQTARQPDGSYRLKMSTLIRRSRAEVFETLSNVRTVERMTPPSAKFRIVSDPDIEMRLGAVVEYSVRIRFFRVKWRSEITEWNPPDSFADTQVKGPFSEWIDRHIFTEVDAETTLVRSDIKYRVPGGALIHKLLVRRDLLKAYRHEQRMIHVLLEG